MRKNIVGMMIFAVLLAAGAAAVYGAGPRITLDGRPMEIETVIDQGATLIPARAMAEAVGGDVQWDGEARQVTITHDETVILLTIDSTAAIVNGNAIELSAPAQIIDGLTMLPLRFVGESLGLAVHWFDADADGDLPTVAMLSPAHAYFGGRAFSTAAHILGDNVLQLYYTPIVSRSEQVLVRLISPEHAGADFYLAIRYRAGYGTAAGLGTQTADKAGFASWRWLVGSRTSLGSWPVTIATGDDIIRFYIQVVE